MVFLEFPGVGAIVFDDRRRLLLVQRANPPAQGRWSVPGGHVEPGESDEAATLRELGYELVSLRAFDLFPHTHHLEALAVFTR